MSVIPSQPITGVIPSEAEESLYFSQDDSPPTILRKILYSLDLGPDPMCKILIPGGLIARY